MFRVFSFLLFLCFFGSLFAEEHHAEEEPESTGLSNFHIPTDLTLSDSFIRAVGTAGALVTGIAGIAAILSFILPIFGFRFCALTGTCDGSYDTTAYSPNMAANSVYDNQAYSGYSYGNNAFRKRSLEYVGPILKMLTAAYDKYGPKAARSFSETKPVAPPAEARR